MKLLQERLLTLKSGRSVKVIARQATGPDSAPSPIEWDVLIRDPNEMHFHPLIQNSHPIYWKLKRLNPLQRKLAALQYSGINKSDVKKIAVELLQLIPKEAPTVTNTNHDFYGL